MADAGTDLSEDVKYELDQRIRNLEQGKTRLYSWEEMKAYVQMLR